MQKRPAVRERRAPAPRARQNVMFEGKEKRLDLINELRAAELWNAASTTVLSVVFKGASIAEFNPFLSEIRAIIKIHGKRPQCECTCKLREGILDAC